MLEYTDKVTQVILTMEPRTVKALNLSLINKKLEEAIQWAQLPKLLCPFALFNLIVLVLPAAFVLLPCSGNLLLGLAGLTLVPHGWFVDSQEGWEGEQEGEEDGKRSHRNNLLLMYLIYLNSATASLPGEASSDEPDTQNWMQKDSGWYQQRWEFMFKF